MSDKVLWIDIFKDFKQRHPNLSKNVEYWRPDNFLRIEIFMKDGTKMMYEYDKHKATFLKDRWKGEE